MQTNMDNWFLYKVGKGIKKKGNTFWQMVLEQLDIHMQKNKLQPIFFTLHKNYFKLAQRSKCENVKQ